MKIAVIGTGYVGLVTGACFSEMGNNVICVDVNEQKIKKLNNGIIPIYEPGLKEIIEENSNKTLHFTTDSKFAINESELVFMAVGTPMSANGSADLSAVYKVAEEIGKHITSHKIVISKSTVPVGTCSKIKEIIQTEINKRKESISFELKSLFD